MTSASVVVNECYMYSSYSYQTTCNDNGNVTSSFYFSCTDCDCTPSSSYSSNILSSYGDDYCGTVKSCTSVFFFFCCFVFFFQFFFANAMFFNFCISLNCTANVKHTNTCKIYSLNVRTEVIQDQKHQV